MSINDHEVERPTLGSCGRRIRHPGKKKFGFGRMVLLKEDSTDERFFRREASQNF